MPRSAPLAERFWAKVTKAEGDDCWAWTGSVRNGYGQIRRDTRSSPEIGAHRVSWELANGLIPRGLCVLHRCDNRRCIRPDHLFLGTRVENNADRHAKGRDGRNIGAVNAGAKLDEATVLAIRKEWSDSNQTACRRAMAEKYGVGKSTIARIVRHESWAHMCEGRR